jgi:hypothetical protein
MLRLFPTMDWRLAASSLSYIDPGSVREDSRQKREGKGHSHLPLSTGGGGDVDESSYVLNPLLRTTLRTLGLCSS